MDDLIFHLTLHESCGLLRVTRKWRQNGYSLDSFVLKGGLFELEGLALYPSRVETIGLFIGAGQIMATWLGLTAELDLEILYIDLLVQRGASINLERWKR